MASGSPRYRSPPIPGAASAGEPVTVAVLADLMQRGAGTTINFDALGAGHKSCNPYSMLLVAGGAACDLLEDEVLYAMLLETNAGHPINRRCPWWTVARVAASMLRHPRILLRAVPLAARKLWALRRALIASRGRAHKLSLFVHGFMGARCLERDRIAACSFTVMTGEGPISMCLHNAKRDDFILQPTQAQSGRWWNPVTGAWSGAAPAARQVTHTRRTLKGRLKVPSA